MKYFEAALLVLFFAGSLVWFAGFARRIRRDYLHKIISRKIFQRQAAQTGRPFYSSELVRQLIISLERQGRQGRLLLQKFADGDFREAGAFIAAKKPNLTAAITAWDDSSRAIEILEEKKRHKAPNEDLLLLARLYSKRGELHKSQLTLDVLRPGKLSIYHRGIKAYLEVFKSLRDGDLLSASEKASLAVRLFRKANALYEEAEAQLLMGTIYRVTAVEDVAQLMLDSAAKLFKGLGAEREEAEVLGNLGMLMEMQDRKEEADAYFERALQLNLKIGQRQGAAEIINQQALSGLIRQDFLQAIQKANEALAIHQELHNSEGEAFSREILSQAAVAEGNWPEVIQQAQKAAAYYKLSGNRPAEQEAWFLQARGEAEVGNPAQAEKILRRLIEQRKKQNSCFYLANAYNLLGLIYLQKGDLKRARGFFQQSLDCELQDNRSDGIAIDYANIALIEQKRGQTGQAIQTIQKALEFAREYGESELSGLLERELNKIQSRH